MANKPILFSGPMVRAILREIEQPGAGKTQTRRVISLPFGHGGDKTSIIEEFVCVGVDKETKRSTFEMKDANEQHVYIPQGKCFQTPIYKPKYGVGDRIWVRETCRAEELSRPPQLRPATAKERRLLKRTEVVSVDKLDGADGVRYLADDGWRIIENTSEAGDRWCELYHYRGTGKEGCGNTVPPIHMPRWASRITLEVTEVRIQHLQEISANDAIAEGIEPYAGIDPECDGFLNYHDLGKSGWWLPPCESFKTLWDSINGKPRKPNGPDISWAANPWVVAYTFKPHLCNIDKMEKAHG